MFYAKFFEFEEFSIVPFFCGSIQPQHTVLTNYYNFFQTSSLYFKFFPYSLGYDQSSYDYFPKKDRIYYPDLSDIRRRRLAEISHEKKNNKAVFKGGLISEDILMVRYCQNVQPKIIKIPQNKYGQYAQLAKTIGGTY